MGESSRALEVAARNEMAKQRKRRGRFCWMCGCNIVCDEAAVASWFDERERPAAVLAWAVDPTDGALAAEFATLDTLYDCEAAWVEDLLRRPSRDE